MHDDDLQGRLRELADEASLRPGSEVAVVKRAKAKRRLVGGIAGLVVVALMGGLAGATTLLANRDGIDPAPGPEETTGCVSAGYDLAVFVPEGATKAELADLGQQLEADERVTNVELVSAQEAEREFRAKEPDHVGRLSTADSTDQYRLKLRPGLDPDPVAKEVAELGDGAYVPALECPPQEPQRTFARYGFEVAKGNASARGAIEVDYEDSTLCLQLASENIMASHLLMDDPDHPRNRSIVLTFFDPSQGETGSQLEPNGTHCFHAEQLGFGLQPLLDQPELFAIDFHRGPDDEPGLVAPLVPQEEQRPSACEDAEAPPTSSGAGLPLRPRQEANNQVVPIVFPDGTSAELVYPSELSSDALTVPFDELLARPYPAGGPQGRMIRPQIFYDGIPAEYEADTLVDCIPGRNGSVPVWDSNEGELIDLVFGRWHVLVFESRRAQGVWARELRGEVVDGGWLVLRGGDELLMGPENDPGDANLMLTLDDTILNLWVLDCEGRHRTDDEWEPGSDFVSYCLADVGIEVHVQGPPEFVQAVYEDLEVRNVTRVFPLEMYELLP